MPTAAEYLRDTSLRMADAYSGDCVQHAWALAESLLAEGKKPWIAAVRWIEMRGETRFHGPLIPLRFAGRRPPTWNTHFVCCSDGEAWDPLVGEPIAIESYTMAVFGRDLPVVEHVSPAALAGAKDVKSLRLLVSPRGTPSPTPSTTAAFPS
jgi:hypothetical protein